MIDWNVVGTLVQVMTLLISIGAYITAWLARRHSATQEAINAVAELLKKETEHRKHEDALMLGRLIVVEQHIIHSPKIDDVNALRAEISGLRAQLGAFEGEMRGVSRGLDLIQQHLLNNAHA